MNFIPFIVTFSLILSSCTSTKLYPPAQAHRDRSEFIAEATKGMISTSHPLASKAGMDMLKKGGNAMDAAAAVSFVISVVRPQSTGIGGGGFMLYYDRTSKLAKVFDFRERAPLQAKRNMYLNKDGSPRDFFYQGQRIANASVNGHMSAGVPGLVAGVIEAHKKYGKLPFDEIIKPAIQIAEQGFRVYKSLAEAIEKRREVLMQFEGSRKLFLPGNQPLKIGDRLVQKDLAWTLRQIKQKGKRGFYKGEVAKRILAEMKRGKGIISQKDLNSYKVKMRSAVSSQYRGYKVVSMPPPSSGGVHIIQMLNILEGYDLAQYKPHSPQTVHLLAEIMRRAFADRAEYLGDPDFVKVPTNALISKAYAKTLRSTIKLDRVTPSKQIQAGDPTPYESRSTTHFSIVDQWGNAVSSTQTVNYLFGSGVVAQDTGIVLNDEMDDFSKKPGVPNAYGLVGSQANAIAAQKTMLSSMSPTIVFNQHGDVELVLGSPGGPRIINATLQTIVNYIDFRMDLADAVHAYRVHHQWLPDKLFYEEAGLDSETRSKLIAMGHQLEKRSAIGSVQAVARTESGWIGVADTRREGYPFGY